MIFKASAIPVALRIRASLDVPRVCKRVCRHIKGHRMSVDWNRVEDSGYPTDLGYVQRGSQCGRYTSSHSSSGDMGRGRVLARGIQE